LLIDSGKFYSRHSPVIASIANILLYSTL
jgi:hypothetical protein